MSRNNKGAFTRAGEYDRWTGDCPLWLENFAAQQAKRAAQTAVDVGRERMAQPSIYDQMSAIISGTAPKFSSVEDAVRDYQKRTGLDEYLKRAGDEKVQDAAKQIVAGILDDDEAEEAEEGMEEPLFDVSKEDRELRALMRDEPLSEMFPPEEEEEEEEEGFWEDEAAVKDEDITPGDIEETLREMEFEKKMRAQEIGPGELTVEDIEEEPLFDVSKEDAELREALEEMGLSDIYAPEELEGELAPEAEKELAPEYRKVAAEKKTPESGEQEDETPEIITSHPAVEAFVRNMVDTSHGIQLPAIQHAILETFRRDGITESHVDDPKLCRFINVIILDKTPPGKSETYTDLGRGVGTQQEHWDLKDSNRDPFVLLVPNKGVY
jgi:hypothetical protein